MRARTEQHDADEMLRMFRADAMRSRTSPPRRTAFNLLLLCLFLFFVWFAAEANRECQEDLDGCRVAMEKYDGLPY